MAAIDPETLPHHVAIIMDGNGRWAKTRNLPRTAGHKQGVDAARRTVKAARDIGVKYLTLFGFSNENWTRPQNEIFDLMSLLRMFLRAEAADLHSNGVRLRVIGRRDRLDADIVEMIEKTESLTASNSVLNLTIALDYGGRQDILETVKALIKKNVAPDSLDEKTFAAHTMTARIPDPDLLIRTSGEERLSNFLLWQCAYTEFFFSEVLWPDFGREHLEQAIIEYACRQRRFGGVDDGSAPLKQTL